MLCACFLYTIGQNWGKVLPKAGSAFKILDIRSSKNTDLGPALLPAAQKIKSIADFIPNKALYMTT